jgi:hypothetical protein
MAENIQVDVQQSRQAVFVRCCPSNHTGKKNIRRAIAVYCPTDAEKSAVT